ncbi:NfeD family protein [Pedobacter insulae]|uniref:Membrane protein implicated in regulation of membrane protease activity n=1 Tax=Pedobacter insulae TaxID=414048 RepID=A0A1I2TLR6_9SPHI|nr:NfeD family protein [Pedobacter insulae]SFG65864.1 Membrane protein implicated in regulation of membrane protease activity [Pedobacter insulae]
MNEIFNNAVIWFCIGFVFFLLEFVFPGFVLFFFGVGAWVVAIASFFFDLSLNTQVLLFIVSSLASVLLFRNWIKRKFGSSDVNSSELEDEFVGKTAIAETAISPDAKGKVEFKGTSWDATSDEFIAAGESVLITATKSILLIVKSIK